MIAEKGEKRHDDEVYGQHELRLARTRELLCERAGGIGRSGGLRWPLCRRWKLYCCPSCHNLRSRLGVELRSGGDRGVLDGRGRERRGWVGL